MTTYPPLDILKPIGQGIWIVDSGPLHAGGVIPLPVRMTIMQLSDGSTLLHSPTRFDQALRLEIERVGPIRHIVAPNSAHWSFVKDWKGRVPEALVWAAPGLRQRRQVKKARIPWHGDLGDASQAHWTADIDQIEVPGIGGFSEVCLFHRNSQALVVTDLIQNLDDHQQSPWMRLFSSLVGARERAPIYLRAVVQLRGEPAKAAARRLVALEPKLVIFSHGRYIDQDAPARLRKSLDWLV
ncbi:DUF4336 domain-containing protein [Rhizobium leguminosarum]|uniref:DUF4336 domain-containing protein n=1 Tax=Rhizobium leguminosarum bv. trifolii (strain WSM1325) TaxID=395491 RepID=C6B745_RHILS|nr:DUF4336 domain-containing protein [Rhizobium leguminosarum]ACS59903.1 conserved hypothetical protein [Rhizobium leguminosarum bv. trifolii WSM1325]RWX23324.1 DUF4336 domain-containing protein [Rhizobium leguminosarum]